MKIQYIVLATVLTVLFSGCRHTTEPIPRGAFAYTSYDSNGVAVVSGWFTMTASDSGIISGEWHFKPIGKPQNIGPQTGDGTLVGGACNEGVCIELNPRFRDNNLQLAGTLEDDRYSGEWTWISLVGISNRGNFEAVRK